ncbi:MAG: CDP-alcohol phosphatidyltransferase family protein [Methanomicrobiaceae archaeon]|nr:CDP-alcohol phosphatidyltransferase family protein [Methanomicrobiaceae archaeon]
MTLDRLRPQMVGYFGPLIRFLARIGVSPDSCTMVAFFGAIAAGVAFFLGEIALGVIAVGINAVFDAMDGAIAREKGIASTRGDFLDHVLDRYADIFIITGIFAGPIARWEIGVFALTGVLMSSYLGTQAQAVGVGRLYGGLLGRADRLVLLILAGLLDLVITGGVLQMRVLAWLLVVFGIFGHFTAIQRFVYVWRSMQKSQNQ